MTEGKKQWVDRVAGRMEWSSELIEITGLDRLEPERVLRELGKLSIPLLRQLDEVLYQSGLCVQDVKKRVAEAGA